MIRTVCQIRRVTFFYLVNICICCFPSSQSHGVLFKTWVDGLRCRWGNDWSKGDFLDKETSGVQCSSHRSKRAMQFRTRATWHTHVQQWGIPHEPLRHEIRAGKSLPLLCASFAPPFSLFKVNPSFLQLTYSHLNVCGVKHLSLLITHRWSLHSPSQHTDMYSKAERPQPDTV